MPFRFWERRPGEISYWWIALAIGSLAVLLALSLWTAVQSVSQGPTLKAESRVGQVWLRGWASKKKVLQADTVRIYLRIENRSGAAIQDVRIDHIDATGFERIKPCWASKLPVCGQGFDPAGAPRGQLGDLEKSRAINLWGSLKPTGQHGARPVLVAISWTGPEGRRSSGNLLVGPIEITSYPLVLGRSSLSFFKDMAFPILLGFLAFIFQRLQQERAQVQQRVDLIAKSAHENAKNLLRICTYLVRFKRYLARKQEGHELILYYFLLALKAMDDLSVKEGGIFLRDQRGEEAVIQCWTALQKLVENDLKERDLTVVLDALDPSVTFTSFQKQFSTSQLTLYPALEPTAKVFKRLEEKFKDKIAQDFVLEAYLLEAVGDVMLYEINRLYEEWYGQSPSFPTSSVEQVVAKLEERLNAQPADPESIRKALKRAKKTLIGYRAAEEKRNPEGFKPEARSGGSSNSGNGAGHGSPPPGATTITSGSSVVNPQTPR